MRREAHTQRTFDALFPDNETPSPNEIYMTDTRRRRVYLILTNMYTYSYVPRYISREFFFFFYIFFLRTYIASQQVRYRYELHKLKMQYCYRFQGCIYKTGMQLEIFKCLLRFKVCTSLHALFATL